MIEAYLILLVGIWIIALAGMIANLIEWYLEKRKRPMERQFHKGAARPYAQKNNTSIVYPKRKCTSMSDIPNYDRDYLNPPPGYESQESNAPYDYCVDCGAEILPGHACFRVGGKTYCETCIENSWEIAG